MQEPIKPARPAAKSKHFKKEPPLDRECGICTRKDRELLFAAYLEEKEWKPAWRKIGETPSWAAFHRHLKHHEARVRAGMCKDPVALATSTITQGSIDDRLEVLIQQVERQIQIMMSPKTTWLPKDRIACIKAAADLVMNLRKAKGEDVKKVDIRIIDHPVFIDLQARIIRALIPFPDAFAAVDMAMAEADSDGPALQ